MQSRKNNLRLIFPLSLSLPVHQLLLSLCLPLLVVLSFLNPSCHRLEPLPLLGSYTGIGDQTIHGLHHPTMQQLIKNLTADIRKNLGEMHRQLVNLDNRLHAIERAWTHGDTTITGVQDRLDREATIDDLTVETKRVMIAAVDKIWSAVYLGVCLM